MEDKKNCILDHRKRIVVGVEEYFTIEVNHNGLKCAEASCMVEGLEYDAKEGWKVIVRAFLIKKIENEN